MPLFLSFLVFLFLFETVSKCQRPVAGFLLQHLSVVSSNRSHACSANVVSYRFRRTNTRIQHEIQSFAPEFDTHTRTHMCTSSRCWTTIRSNPSIHADLDVNTPVFSQDILPQIEISRRTLEKDQVCHVHVSRSLRRKSRYAF